MSIAPDGDEYGRKPWDRIPEEGSRAYAAFVVYRDLPPRERSLLATERIQRRKPDVPTATGRYVEWFRAWNWLKRAQAWDEHLDRLAQRTREEEHETLIRAHQARQRKLGELQQDVAVEIVEKARAALKAARIKDIPAASLPAFFRAAAVVAQSGSNAEAQALAVGHLLDELQTPGPALHSEEEP